MKHLATIPFTSFGTQAAENRAPGVCDALVNFTPTIIAGSQVTRRGYSDQTPTLPTGVTLEYLRYAKMFTPTEDDVSILFGDNSGTKQIYMKPYVSQANAWVDDWVNVREYLNDTIKTGTISGQTFQLTTNSKADNYYKGWLVHNVATDKYLYVTSHVSNVLTVVGNMAGVANDQALQLRRYAHRIGFINPGTTTSAFFDAIWSTPNIDALDDGGIRMRLGRASGEDHSPLWLGNIKRTYFTGATPITYVGTYAALRGIYADASFYGDTITGVGGGLGQDKTYWSAFCLVYDGNQRSPLTEVGGMFLATGPGADGISWDIHVTPSFNKRITAIEFYMSEDDGDTSSSGRINPYYYFGQNSIISSTDVDFAWSYASGIWSATVVPTADIWGQRGDRYERRSGYEMNVDTMFDHDLEISHGMRQYIARAEFSSIPLHADLTNIYTNPIGISGLAQLDIFPNQVDVYAVKTLLSDTSEITGLHSMSNGRIIVLKNRGVVEILPQSLEDNGIAFQQYVLDTNIGCPSLLGSVKVGGGLYFIGNDDIYHYNGRFVPLTDGRWKDSIAGTNYRSVSGKSTGVAWFNPLDSGVYFYFGSVGYVYLTTIDRWVQANFIDAPQSIMIDSDKYVRFTNSGNVYRFDFTTNDGTIAIVPKIDTGKFRVAPEGEAIRLQELWLNFGYESTVGTLLADLYLYHNYVLVASIENISCQQDTQRNWIPIPIGTNPVCDMIQFKLNDGGEAETIIEVKNLEIFGEPFKKWYNG